MKVFLPSIMFCLFFLLLQTNSQAQSISETYTYGDIPTSFNVFDPSCTGPSAVLLFTLPPGDNYPVTGIDISYTMTAIGQGWMSEQRSYIHCLNTGVSEVEYAGDGNLAGTYSYSRSGVSIANELYPGGTTLVFEMRAWRTWEGIPGCHTNINRVDAGSWTITIYYGGEIENPNVGVNRTDPNATLDVSGKLKIGDDTNAPEAGMIRWNTETEDFEGFNGMVWVSLTQSRNEWGSKTANENYSVLSPLNASGDLCGQSVSISGEFAIVGSPGNNSGQGMATIYERSGNTWLFETNLYASDGAAWSYFGQSVAISGYYVIIGAPQHDVGANSNQGKAYIFYYDGSSWSEQMSLTGSGGTANDYFGGSVNIDGDYAIIGAPAISIPGKAYIFKREGVLWAEDALFNGISSQDYFGQSVDISGDYAIIGAPHDDTGGMDQGRTTIYKRSGDTWSEQAAIAFGFGGTSSKMGNSVAISGDYALTGVPFYDVDGNVDQGVFLFMERIGNAWSLYSPIVASDGIAYDEFGSSVDISGKFVVIGAENNTSSMLAPNAGKAYVFEITPNLCAENTILKATDPRSFDRFGTSVSIFSNYIVVGAPYRTVNDPPIATGLAYFFYK